MTLLDEAFQQYCQLLERGETVDVEEFCRGFPELKETLHRQIEVNHLIVNDLSSLLRDLRVAWPQSGDCMMGFKLREQIGKGAFSHVFLATDNNLGDRQVAVKICHAGEHEAWILGKLKHENIVPIHSIQRDPDSGLSLICMPYLGCTTLRDVVTSVWSSKVVPSRASQFLVAGRMSDGPSGRCRVKQKAHRVLKRGSYVEGVVFVGSKIAGALAHAHREGIRHLDMKPANVLMDDHGCPRLLDFNLASDRTKGVPRIGGTLPYMSPEQAQCYLNHADGTVLDQRSDIFSFGVLMYEMLCGELPYGKETQTLSSRAVVERLIRRQTHFQMSNKWSQLRVDERVSAIIKRCLAVDPKERYESADALAADLQRELSVLRTARRWVRSHRRSVVTAVGAAIILGGSVRITGDLETPSPESAVPCDWRCITNKKRSVLRFLPRCLSAGSGVTVAPNSPVVERVDMNMSKDLTRPFPRDTRRTRLTFAFLGILGTASVFANQPMVVVVNDIQSTSAEEVPRSDVEKPQVEPWRVMNRCGINSVYVFLRLHGQPVSYEEVVSALPIRERGVSLAEMKTVVRNNGISAEVARVSPESLHLCSLPLIALLEHDKAEGGHFVVILRASRDSVEFVDGTSGAVDLISYADFLRQWHGYVLIGGKPVNWLERLYLVSIAIALASVGWAVWTYVLWQRHEVA